MTPVSIILFFLGFYILIKGADFLVRGASSLARIFGLSPWFIGMTIVGIGTSIPELSITIVSVLEGNNIGTAMIIGSSTLNILFVIGLTAALYSLTFKREWILRDLPFGVIALVAACSFMYLPVMGTGSGITRMEGVVLLVMFFAWIYDLVRRKSIKQEEADTQVFSWTVSLVFVFAGLLGVLFGGTWVVDGASALAALMHVRPELIGFTVLAFGTSVPNMVVSIIAARKGLMGIAIGNVVGSNVFYFLGIFGITAIIHPIPLLGGMLIDVYIAFCAAVLLFICALRGRQHFAISRFEGVVFVCLYLAYLLFLIIRG